MPRTEIANATPIVDTSFVSVGALNYADGFWAVMKPNISVWGFIILSWLMVAVISWIVMRFTFWWFK